MKAEKDLSYAGAQLARFCRCYIQAKVDMPIRPSEMGVLNVLCTAVGPHTPVSLASALCVSRPMIAAHLNALVARGLITRVPSPEDGRSFYILPSKRGRDLFESVSKFEAERLNAMMAKLGQKKFDDFIKLVAAVNQVLD